MKKIYVILLFLVFMACNNSKAEELKKEKNTDEEMAEISTVSKNEKSCMEFEKYNINTEKIEL